jgi:hypothetical protein
MTVVTRDFLVVGGGSVPYKLPKSPELNCTFSVGCLAPLAAASERNSRSFFAFLLN